MSPSVLLFLLTLENRSSNTYPAEVTGGWRGGSHMTVLLSAAGCRLSCCLPIRFWAVANQKEGREAYNITSFVLTVTWRNSLLIDGLWWAKKQTIHWSQKHYKMQIFGGGIGRMLAMNFIYVRSISLCLGPLRQKIDSLACQGALSVSSIIQGRS